MLNLSTLLQLLIKNKAYYLKTKLGLALYHRETLHHQQLFENENGERRKSSRTVGNRGTPKPTTLCRHVPGKF